VKVKAVLASSNAGKVREFAALLATRHIEVIPQSEVGIIAPEETGTTFLENALLKARHAAQISGLAALADDSGIEVDALDGRPGVWSARYAGAHASDADNLNLLLRELAGVPEAQRRARYRCVLVFMRAAADPDPIVTSGVWEGRVLTAPRGVGGFGYDSIFQPDGCELSAAQLPAVQKNALSHRAQALRALLAALV
jgi:XTP/dITP diphosphohydrolase